MTALLELAGTVPWEWLAGCRECGAPHPSLPDPRGSRGYAWASGADGHPYQPRVHRWQLDTLLVEYRTVQTPASSDGDGGRR